MPARAERTSHLRRRQATGTRSWPGTASTSARRSSATGSTLARFTSTRPWRTCRRRSAVPWRSSDSSCSSRWERRCCCRRDCNGSSPRRSSNSRKPRRGSPRAATIRSASSSDAKDELGTLFDQFNAMLDQIERGGKELQQAHAELEVRVEERTEQLSRANGDLTREVAERKRTEQELETVHQQLLDAARRAGMAEVATGVLHNVGNVLNSVNVSATLVVERLRRSKVAELGRAVEMMNRDGADLGDFLSEDQKGKQLGGFLPLAGVALDPRPGRVARGNALPDQERRTRQDDHRHAAIVRPGRRAHRNRRPGESGRRRLETERLLIRKARDRVGSPVSRTCPQVRVDKQRVLQILVNLVRNARDALVEHGRGNRRLIARTAIDGETEEKKVLIEIVDNGVGNRQGKPDADLLTWFYDQEGRPRVRPAQFGQCRKGTGRLADRATATARDAARSSPWNCHFNPVEAPK